MLESTAPVNIACLIHGTGYSIDYVHRLESMLARNLSRPIALHVFTEAERVLPQHWHKHVLVDWNFSGTRSSWWYKLQLFRPDEFDSTVIYFDLDVVITASIDWMLELDPAHFWAVRDFQYLQRARSRMLNSSIMSWQPSKTAAIWQGVCDLGINWMRSRWPGDQDYLAQVVREPLLAFLPEEQVISWRWQAAQGGYDFARRCYRAPHLQCTATDASVLVFHGDPKPAAVADSIVLQNWR